MNAPDLSINQLIEDSYNNSYDHGFWNGPEQDNIPTKIALLHSEASEALESFRDPDSDKMVKVPESVVAALLEPNFYADRSEGSIAVETKRAEAMAEIGILYEKWKAKPKGFDIELADALIRIFDLAGRKDIDLNAALARKMEYNKGREHMHGRRV